MPHVPQTKLSTTVQHNHPYINSCNCLHLGVSSYLCRDGYVGRWYSTLFVAHEVVVTTFTILSLFAYFVCLYHPYILLVFILFYLYIMVAVTTLLTSKAQGK